MKTCIFVEYNLIDKEVAQINHYSYIIVYFIYLSTCLLHNVKTTITTKITAKTFAGTDSGNKDA